MGRLQMFVDIFPLTEGAPTPPLRISPRVPVNYNLRVVVWTATDVPLVDTSVTGDDVVDIFVKVSIQLPHFASPLVYL